MELMDKYLNTFGQLPELPPTTSYNNPIMVKLMEEAIKRNSPLTEEEVFDAYEGRYDLLKD